MTQATYAKFASEVSDIKEQVELKQLKDDSYYTGTINEFLGTTSNYNNKLLMQEGELVYVSSSVSSREAKWFEQLGIQKSSDYFTVEFDTAGGTEINSQSIKVGKTVKKPNNPSKAGCEFLGWYYTIQGGTITNPTFTEVEFDFSTIITSDYYLYAKYTGEAVMTRYKENELFWKYKEEITNIIFTSNSSLIPNNVKESWNIKADNNCYDIMAYLEDSTYKLVIYSDRTIYANTYPMLYFSDFSNLSSIVFDNFDTSKCVNMLRMFANCGNLESLNLNNFVTNKVTHMNLMFSDSSKLKSLDLSSFNTINLKSMYHMFKNCKSLESINLSSFNTEKVVEMSRLFRECNNLKELDLSGFKTSSLKGSVDEMFYNCTNLETLRLNNFDTTNVTNMNSMFRGCTSLKELDLSSFNTQNVTNMTYMFCNDSNLSTIYVGNGWSTDNATVTSMFYKCKTKEVTLKSN